jgi:transglutaminase-like putative cysteine protease
MSRTWLSVLTALGLSAASLAVLLGRWYFSGAETDWKVTLLVDGELTAADATLTTLLPRDFRYQHVTDETFRSDQLDHRVRRRSDGLNRLVVWRRRATLPPGPQPFRLDYSFHCTTAMLAPTPAMARQTHRIDAAPAEGQYLRPSPRIESRHEAIATRAEELAQDHPTAVEQVRAFFEYVHDLADEPAGAGSGSALTCLRRLGGDSGAKSRLLVALCRSHGIPARLVSGVRLTAGTDQNLHQWAEAYVDDHWLPMCPSYGYFGSAAFPENYFVLHVGDGDPVRGHGSRYHYRFQVERLGPASDSEGAAPPSAGTVFWRKVSLYSLRPVEQHLVKFLLLLPLGALIVSLFRTIVGIPTFGTFSPALLGLAFLDLRALPWGLAIFVLTVLAGWGMRRFLDVYHLLLVARVSALLTLIVVFLVVLIAVASRYGIAATQFVSLFPLVILTHLVERFWTIEAEDSTAASFKTLLGTVVVTVVISVALSWDGISRWMFRYPETLGVVLAAQFLLGRYTGYRISELYRFGDLLTEEPAAGGGHELADALSAPAGAGHPGDEPPQHGMHPRPEPPAVVPPGRSEVADA